MRNTFNVLSKNPIVEDDKIIREKDKCLQYFREYESCRDTISKLLQLDIFNKMNKSGTASNKIITLFEILYECSSMLRYISPDIDKCIEDKDYLKEFYSKDSLMNKKELRAYEGVFECIELLYKSYNKILNQGKDDISRHFFGNVYESIFNYIIENDINVINDLKDNRQQIENAYWNAKGNALLKKADYFNKRFVEHELVERVYESALLCFLKIVEDKNNKSPYTYTYVVACHNCGECFRKKGNTKYKDAINWYERVRDIFINDDWIKEGEEKNRVYLYNKLRLTTINKLGICATTEEEAMRFFGETILFFNDHKFYDENFIKKDKKGIINIILNDQDISIDREDKKNRILDKVKKGDLILTKQDNQDIDYEDEKGLLLQALLNLGIRKRKSGKFRRALILFEAMLTFFDPNNVDAKNNKGVCLRKIGEYQEAMKIFEENTHCLYGVKFARFNILKCMIELNISEDNVKIELEHMLDQNERNTEALFHLGIYYCTKIHKNEKEDINIAIRYFEKVCEIEPALQKKSLYLKALYKIGDCYTRLKRYHDAIRIFDRILKEEENDVLSIINKGWCLQNLNYYDEAIQVYGKIENARENFTIRKEIDVRLYNNLGVCHYNLALDYYNKYKKNINDAKASDNLNKSADIFNRAVDKFEIAMKLNKNYYNLYNKANCHRMISKCLLESEKFAKAKENYIEAYNLIKESLIQSPFDENVNSYYLICICEILDKRNVNLLNFEDDFIDKIENEIKACLLKSFNTYSLAGCIALYKYIDSIHNVDTKNEFYNNFSSLLLAKHDEGFIPFNNLYQEPAYLLLCKDINKGKINKELFCLYNEIVAIKNECRITHEHSNDPICYVHYTKLNTLKILLSSTPSHFQKRNDKPLKGIENNDEKSSARLRLWNTSYMNDYLEGEIFFKLNDNLNAIACDYYPFKKENSSKYKPYNSNVYMTSFSHAIDDISMWTHYAEYASGCSIKFDKDFFAIRGKINDITQLFYNKYSYPLYNVQYVNDKNELVDKEKNIIIKEKIKNIYYHIKQIEELLRPYKKQDNTNNNEILFNTEPQFKQDKVNEDIVHAVRSFIANVLNEIRYLFKSKDFAHEKEVRVIKSSNDVKIDEHSFQNPRVYIELDRDIKIEELQLGPKVTNINDSVPWLCTTKKVNYISKSKTTLK